VRNVQRRGQGSGGIGGGGCCLDAPSLPPLIALSRASGSASGMSGACQAACWALQPRHPCPRTSPQLTTPRCSLQLKTAAASLCRRHRASEHSASGSQAVCRLALLDYLACAWRENRRPCQRGLARRSRLRRANVTPTRPSPRIGLLPRCPRPRFVSQGSPRLLP
jgi:hypothetical protein